VSRQPLSRATARGERAQEYSELLDRLWAAVGLAQQDWQDALVGAGSGEPRTPNKSLRPTAASNCGVGPGDERKSGVTRPN
jgi:hypothetical protein